MVPANHRPSAKGQILIEVTLVLLLIVVVFVGALTQLGQVRPRNQRFQFTQEKRHGKNPSPQVRH